MPIAHTFYLSVNEVLKIRFSYIILILSLTSPFVSRSEIKSYIPTPRSASLGYSGRAAINSIEYHTLNAATIMKTSSYSHSGFYIFDETQSYMGVTASNNKSSTPYTATWIRSATVGHRVIWSMAGLLGREGAVGINIHYFPKDHYFYPHLGLLYQFAQTLHLGFTIDFLNAHFSNKDLTKDIVYGFGLHYAMTPSLQMQGDIVYEQKEWMLRGGLEFIPSSYLSIRIGQSWPLSFYNLGLSLKTSNVEFNYTWMQAGGHIVGVQAKLN